MPFVPFENGSGPRFVPFDAQYPEPNSADQKKKGRTVGQVLSDTGAQLAEGVNTIVGAVPDLVAPESTTAQFFRGNADYWRDAQSDNLKERIASAGQKIDEAGKNGVLSQAGAAISEYASDPALAARFVVTNLPSMIPGVGAAKLAQGAALARGATAAKAAAAATTAGGVANSVLNAGGARGEAFEDIKQTLVSQGVDPASAEEIALKESLLPAAIGGAAGFVSGKTGLESSLFGKATGKSAAKAGISATAAELAGEQLEEVAPKLATNYQAGQHDNRSMGKDVGRTMVETAIGSGPGAMLAGGASALDVRRNDPPVNADPIQTDTPQPSAPAKTRIMYGPDGRAMAVPVESAPQQQEQVTQPASVSVEADANAGASAILDELTRAQSRLDTLNDPANGYGQTFDAERAELAQEVDALKQAATEEKSAPNISEPAPSTAAEAPNIQTEGGVRQSDVQDEVHAPAIEPHAMPLMQFVAGQQEAAKQSAVDAPSAMASTLKHADAIESALSEGKDVPSRVLMEHAQTVGQYAEYFPRLAQAVQENTDKVAGIDAQIQKLTAEATTRSAPVAASIGRQVAKLQTQKSELTGQPVIESPAVARPMQQPATAQRDTGLQPVISQQVIENSHPAASERVFNGRLTPLQDERIAKHAQELQALANESGWAERGGKLIRDHATGDVTGRTKWIPNADWWAVLDAGSRLDQAASVKAVNKAIAGEPLTAKEKRAVAAMLDVADINEQRYADTTDIDGATAMQDDESTAEREAIQDEAAAQAVTDNELDQLSDAVFNGEEGTLTDDEIRQWLGEDTETAAGRGAAEVGPGYQAGDNYSGSSEARPAGAQRPEVGGTVAGGDAQGNQGNEQEDAVTDDFALQSQTEQGLRQQDDARRDAAAAEDAARKQAEQKAQADAERDSFALTGSDRAADIGTAHGQGGLFDAPAESSSAQKSARSPENTAETPQNAASSAEMIAAIDSLIAEGERRRDAGEPPSKRGDSLAYAPPPGDGDYNSPRNWLTENELTRLHDLQQSLPSAGEERDAARARIQEKLAQRKARADAPLFSVSGGFHSEVGEAIRAGLDGDRQSLRQQVSLDIKTPAVLQMLGVAEKPVFTNRDLIAKMHIEHGLTKAQLNDLPGMLDKPAMVFESDTQPGRFLVVTSVVSGGRPVVIAVEPNGRLLGRDQIDVVMLPSAYPKDNADSQITKWIKAGRLLYADKGESRRLATTAKLQLPGVVQRAVGFTPKKYKTDSDLQQYRAELGLYSFAGTSAATADTYALSTAQQRIAAGEDAETVRRETGWFKGADGQWRFEIDDSNAQLKRDSRDVEQYADIFDEAASHAVPLADVLDHPALFAAYPRLASVKVAVDQSVAQGGRYNENTRTITVNDPYSYRGGHDELKSVLLHEIQHGIQDVEGFATGGNPKELADSMPDTLAINDAKVLRMRRDRGDSADDASVWFLNNVGRDAHPDARYMSSLYTTEELRKMPSTPQEKYRRLAGEVEARNVQARANLTDRERRIVPPRQTADVADQDVILVFNGKEMAHAPAIANGPNTAATLRATLAADELGPVVTSLIKSGRIVLHDTQASFNPDLKFKVNGVTTADGKVHLIAENLTQKNAMAVLLHELFHLNGKNLIDTPNWTRLMQSLEQAMVMAKNTKGRLGDFYREAERRLEIAKRAGPVGIQAEEFGAYMIEHFEQAPASLRKLAEKIVGEVKAWLLRSFGMQAGRVTPGQLRAIARAALVDAAEHAGGDVRVVNGRLAYSRDGADRFSTDQKTLNVNGVDRPVLNADGKPIHNTQQGIINFWKWYDELQQRRVVRQDARGQGREGNREATGRTSLSSHFFDEQGRPKIFYHGTGAEVSEFDLDHPDKWDHGWLGKGVYLASDHELARFYSDQKHGNPNIMPLYAGVSNPYEFTFAWKQKLRNATPQEIAAVTDALMANGYDGGVLKFGDGSLEVVAFDNRAIKSAIGNTGAFDPANPDIRFSITDDAAQKVKDQIDNLRSPGTLDSIIYTMQDKLIDLRRMTEHMQKAGTLFERINAYLAEELYHGRVAKRHGDFIKNELRPLMAGVRAAGFTPQAFEEYLHARHAPERNAEMAKRNPSMQEVSAGIDAATKRVKDLEVQLSRASARGMATSAVEKALNEARGELSDWLNAQPFHGTEDERLSLSGMSDEQARQVMAKYTPKQLADLDALGKRVDAINESTLKTLETYGLETKEMLDKWRSAYAHYVPLHRDEAHPDSAYHPIGQGFSIKGGASKRATGSNEKVTNILGHLAQQREAALTRGEKNLVAQTLFMQIKALDDAGFAEVNAPKMRTFVDGRTGFTRRELDNNYRNANNVMMLKVAGRDAAIMFNERNPQAMRMAGALKNMDATDMGWFASRMAPITRWFASVNTQFNPIFGMVNLLRDSSAGALNLSSTPLNGKQKEVMAEAANILRQSLRNGLRLPKQGKVAALWEDFQNTGGQTGYRELYRDASDRAKDIQKEFDALDRGTFSQKLHNMADWLSDFNEAMENTIRLAAYKVALENGMSKKEAASLAKNLTVNFNRKGKIGRDAGALYAFFNASVQGTTRMMQTLRGPAGKRIVLGGLTMGAMQALIGAAMMGGGDDEDDEWAKIPEFVKERNLIIPISGKDYVTIPLPLGFHVIPNAGRLAMETLMGRKSVGDATGAMLWSAVESFNPIGTSSFMQTLTPTAFDPAMALAENKDWTGSSIYRENMSQLDPEPGHRLAKASASAFGYGVSRAVNWMTGGNEYRPGMVSWTPDQIDYVIGQITGGVGREMLKATQVVSAPITGDELPAHKVPLLGRFYGNTRGVLANTDQFYNNIRDINIAENELKGRMKDGDYDGASSVRESDPLASLVGNGNAAENMVRKLKQQRRNIQKRADDGWRDDVKAVDEQIAEVMKGLNRQVREAKDKK